MPNTTFGKEYFKSLLNRSREERIKEFEEAYDVTDIEYRACDFFYKITDRFNRNMADEAGSGHCEKEKELLEDLLVVRRSMLDCHFVWTDYYKTQLTELNKKVKNCVSLAYEEANLKYRIEHETEFHAHTQFNVLKERVHADDPYLKTFDIRIGVVPITNDPRKDGLEETSTYTNEFRIVSLSSTIRP